MISNITCFAAGIAFGIGFTAYAMAMMLDQKIPGWYEKFFGDEAE
jgi:hypothetical protein